MTLRPYQRRAVDASIAWMRKSVDPFLIEAATGCHERGHPILMHDGTAKPVETVCVGDHVMSANGRDIARVTETHTGRQQMFRVTPTKGEPFVVNRDHVLSLYVTPARKRCPSEYKELTVGQYLKSTKTFRHRAKLYRVPCEFRNRRSSPDAWAVGAIIGDGSTVGLTPTFCTPDKEVLNGISEFARRYGCEVRKMKGDRTAPNYSICDPMANRSSANRVTEFLRHLGVMGKHAGERRVPCKFMTASTFTRLEMIAGLIDTDGHLSRGGYDWISKSEGLADDMVFLCRSVGLAAYKARCKKGIQSTGFSGVYWRVSISGYCSMVPCRVARKRAPERSQIKNHLVTGFSVEDVGEGDFYGFSIDTPDRLYLDGNFVAHHNSGKSHIIAEVAHSIHNSTGKRVLCLAPSAELVTQNRAKYLASGNPCSMFSASAGAKELRHPVVFGSPLTVKNRISRFCQSGNSGYALVVIDECHGITPTVQGIIEEMRKANPLLRVMGLTATPYRLGSGYIYSIDQNGRPVDQTRDPYFMACVDCIRAPELIGQGYLTPPVIGGVNAKGYDTSALVANARGQFDAAAVDQAYHGHGRKTAAIVADVVEQSRDRRGVILFAATVQHAREVMASLPPHLSAIVTAETPKGERSSILRRFLAREIKYLVNVSVLTTGFDAPHVDVVAMLRKTESVGLLQQIIGRGLRLDAGKKDCLVLDYTTNIEDHCPDGDIFRPIVKAGKEADGSGAFDAECEHCGTMNPVTIRPDYVGKDGSLTVDVDAAGYVLDLDGNRVMTDHGPMPMHFGRRCVGYVRVGPNGEHARCSYRWTSKECPHCEAPNDISARYCVECKGEIVDPNEKLLGDFRAMKRDPMQRQTDRVVSMECRPGVSGRGNKTMRVDFVTPYRSFSIWLMPEGTHTKAMREWQMLQAATKDDMTPKTVTYQKNDDGFYRVHGYNAPEDAEPVDVSRHAAE